MSALAGTIAAPLAARRGGADVMRWLRSGISLALALGILAIALPAAFGAGARGTGADPIQVFSSGPAVAVSASSSARLAVDGLVPGDTRDTTIRISNAGSGPTALALTADLADRARPGGVPLSSVLELRIAVPSGAVIYNGTLADLGQVPLGRIEAGGTRALRFTVTLPRGVGNAVEGSALSAGFNWVAG